MKRSCRRRQIAARTWGCPRGANFDLHFVRERSLWWAWLNHKYTLFNICLLALLYVPHDNNVYLNLLDKDRIQVEQDLSVEIGMHIHNPLLRICIGNPMSTKLCQLTRDVRILNTSNSLNLEVVLHVGE